MPIEEAKPVLEIQFSDRMRFSDAPGWFVRASVFIGGDVFYSQSVYEEYDKTTTEEARNKAKENLLAMLKNAHAAYEKLTK